MPLWLGRGSLPKTGNNADTAKTPEGRKEIRVSRKARDNVGRVTPTCFLQVLDAARECRSSAGKNALPTNRLEH